MAEAWGSVTSTPVKESIMHVLCQTTINQTGMELNNPEVGVGGRLYDHYLPDPGSMHEWMF